MTKPIIVVKMPGCRLLYIIQVKRFSWPYLISETLIAYNYSYNAVSDWPSIFLQPGYFCLVQIYIQANEIEATPIELHYKINGE